MSGGFVVFHRRGFCEVTSKSRPAWLQDGSVVAVTFRLGSHLDFQSNQSGLLSLSIATSSLSGSFSEEAKHAWRDAHWEEDLQRAYDSGRRMAEQ